MESGIIKKPDLDDLENRAYAAILRQIEQGPAGAGGNGAFDSLARAAFDLASAMVARRLNERRPTRTGIEMNVSMPSLSDAEREQLVAEFDATKALLSPDDLNKK